MKPMMVPVLRRVGLIAAILSAFASNALAADSVDSPGKTSEITSPNGLYTILNVDEPGEGKKVPRHHLYLLRKNRAGKQDLYSYASNVEILWSPDSSAFIVNDWLGGSHAESKLYRVSNLGYPESIDWKLLHAIRNTKDAIDIARSGHNYIFVSRWINSRKIEVSVGAYGSPVGEFTIHYVWDLKSSFKKVKRESKFRTDRDRPPSN